MNGINSMYPLKEGWGEGKTAYLKGIYRQKPEIHPETKICLQRPRLSHTIQLMIDMTYPTRNLPHDPT